MAITLLHSDVGGTVVTIDSTGASFIALWVSGNVIVAPTDLTQPNTILGPLNTCACSNGGSAQLYYIESPITSSSHSFGTTTTFPTIIAAAFSNTATSAIFDGQQNHADAQASPAQGGSVTPVSANSMVLSGVVASDSAISSVDSSFSVIQDRTGTGGVSYGTALAYLVETTIAAQNPAWTHTAANIGVWNGSFAPVSAGSYTVVLIRS